VTFEGELAACPDRLGRTRSIRHGVSRSPEFALGSAAREAREEATMADKSDKKAKATVHPTLMKAREAKVLGDHKQARVFAKELLQDAAATDSDKAEAGAMVEAVGIDRAPLIVGVVIALVLAGLFTFVANQTHVH